MLERKPHDPSLVVVTRRGPRSPLGLEGLERAAARLSPRRPRRHSWEKVDGQCRMSPHMFIKSIELSRQPATSQCCGCRDGGGIGPPGDREFRHFAILRRIPSALCALCALRSALCPGWRSVCPGFAALPWRWAPAGGDWSRASTTEASRAVPPTARVWRILAINSIRTSACSAMAYGGGGGARSALLVLARSLVRASGRVRAKRRWPVAPHCSCQLPSDRTQHRLLARRQRDARRALTDGEPARLVRRRRLAQAARAAQRSETYVRTSSVR